MYLIIGQGVLFCSTPTAPLLGPQVDLPWVAVDVGLYGQGWACGDQIRVTGPGWQLEAYALDAGPLAGYYVRQVGGGLLPIVVDIPAHLAPFEGLSSGPVSVYNLTLAHRMCKERGLFP